MKGGMGPIIGAIITMFIAASVLVTFSAEYGTASATASLNNTYLQGIANYTNAFYNPITSNITTGISASNNLAQSSSIIGFALAFILPGLANVLSASVHAPVLLGSFLATLFAILPMQGYNTAFLITQIENAITLVIFGLFLSMWSKWPWL